MTVASAGAMSSRERHARPARLLRFDDARQQPLEQDRLPADVAGLLAEAVEGDDVLDEPLEPLGLLVDVAEDAAASSPRRASNARGPAASRRRRWSSPASAARATGRR